MAGHLWWMEESEIGILDIDTGISTNYDPCLASSASWFESSFFINLVVREDLSFTQAKLIALAWDTFVGQGLRFLHAWWLYQVGTHVVTCCLETSGLTYDFLLDILFRTDSFPSLFAACRMIARENWASCRLYGAWLTFLIGYILLFPTIWATSTGTLVPVSWHITYPTKLTSL
ncbi:hypothetical protein F5Y09DRAFT_14700 [Xylaria sp. FL1042]|nr:hypothetical protein F5Y09DRAFT_14700 [Xylaria sp. FL1042]